MGRIGSYLNVVFTVNSKSVNTFTNLSRTYEARFEKYSIQNQKPLLQFDGIEGDDISFDVKLSAHLGVNPTKELKKWQDAISTGRKGIFTLGNKPLSNNPFVIKRITEKQTSHDNDGRLLAIELSIELSEYPVRAQNKKPKTAAKNNTSPASKKLLGNITITAKSIHIRNGRGTQYKVLGYGFKGEKFKVYGKTNGWYDLGNGKYMSANTSYSQFKGVT